MPKRRGSSPDHSTKNQETERLITLLQRSAPELTQRYRMRSIGIFGSYARRQLRQRSDLDVLLKFIEMEIHLSDLLGVKVDLVMREGLKPGIGERILSEVIPL